MSSDSDAAGGSASAFGSMPTAPSAGSPSIPYHFTMQPQPQHPRPDSPSHNNILPSYLQSPPHNADPYSQGPQNSSNHSLYNSMNSVDFSVSSSEQDAHNAQTTASGYPSSGPFRTSVSTFSPFSNPGRVRQNTASFRDTSTNFTTPNYAQVHADIFVPNNMQQNPPHSAGGAYEPIHHPGRYDYALSASQSAPSLMPNGQTKQFTVMDAYRLGLDPSLNLTQQMKMSSSGSPPGMMRDAQVPQMSMQQGAQQSFQTQLNGISHQLPHQLQPQGPFQSVNGSAPVSGTQAGLANGAGTQQGSQQQPQEEISTIFVVGFPDDMSVSPLCLLSRCRIQR